MAIKELQLFANRRYLPLFISQFFGLINDNLYKYTLIMFITFSLAQNNERAQLLINLMGGLYGVAFFFFSIPLGQLADKYNRNNIIIFMKLLEVGLILTGMLACITGHIIFCLIVVFCLGIHSASLGPIKFSMLPDLLEANNLLVANAFLVASGIIAILLGAILGIGLGSSYTGVMIIGGLAVTLAISGCLASFAIPRVPILDPLERINFLAILQLFRYIYQDKKVFFTILGIAWSVLVAVAVLRQFPVYAKMFISTKQIQVLVLFIPFALGAMLGAIFCNRVFKGKITTKHVPVILIFTSLILFDFAHESSHILPPLILGSVQSTRLLTDVFLIPLLLSLCIIPLYARLQIDSEADHRARILAVNNLMLSLFTVFAAVGIIVFIKLKLSLPEMFANIALINLLAALFFWRTYKKLDLQPK